MNNKEGIIFYIILTIFFFSSMILIDNASANFSIYDVDHSLIQSQGKVYPTNVSVFLKEINITLDLYEKYIEGNGEYILKNPSNHSENLTLFFDPSYNPKECKISINGDKILSWYQELDRFYYSTLDGSFAWGKNTSYSVILFNLSIDAYSEKKVDVFWRANSKIKYTLESSDIDTNYGLFSNDKVWVTNWGTSYLIISNRTWPKPIENFRITFISHAKKFDNPYIEINRIYQELTNERIHYLNFTKYPINITKYTNENAHTVVFIHLKSWYEYDTMINYHGPEEEKPVRSIFNINTENPLLIFCTLLILILFPFLLLIINSFIGVRRFTLLKKPVKNCPKCGHELPIFRVPTFKQFLRGGQTCKKCNYEIFM